MNNYKGLFTFDVDNHRYLPIEQADGLISDMFYNPEPKEEPKEYWWIDTGSIPMVRKSNNPILSTAEDIDKEIGNYFESEEEAERAVEKLKAWKRLRDKGLEVTEWAAGLGDDNYKIGEVMVGFDINGVHDGDVPNDIEEDLDLLFGGKE